MARSAAPGEGAPGVDPWTNVARLAPVPGDLVSLVEGSTFAISDASGDIAPLGAQGLFHRDTRFLSRLELRVNGDEPESLAARTVDAYSARFVLRLPWSGPGESPLVAVRSRFVGDGLHEDLDVTNHGDTPVRLRVELLVDADLADLFEVRLGGPGRTTAEDVVRRPSPDQGRLDIEHGPGRPPDRRWAPGWPWAPSCSSSQLPSRSSRRPDRPGQPPSDSWPRAARPSSRRRATPSATSP